MAIEQQMVADSFGKLNVILYQKKSHKWMGLSVLRVRFVSGFCGSYPVMGAKPRKCQMGGYYDKSFF
jgi:hypothetical protein